MKLMNELGKEFDHITDKRTILLLKILTILKSVAWAALMFCAGAVYAYIRCAMGVYN